jgi:hypothetical protein
MIRSSRTARAADRREERAITLNAGTLDRRTFPPWIDNRVYVRTEPSL